MAEPARAEVRYTAFLSYSHTDAAAAGRLHRRLEAYRMPKRLAGSPGARGPVPDRLWPIFRDREELPAATDLSETVRAALGQSGALIILCSPAAAGSLWVAEEIETFRTLHPDRPILAAILDGDPPDCFPAALRAFGRDGTWHEPLATDLRPGKDGAHLGLLKLVAGITGVGLDALVQRDASRRVRRITVLSALALAALLIMTGLAVVAINARREAERQRAEAEGLIEFMLTDLREELRGVGRLQPMYAVNRRALAYYDRQRSSHERPADSAMEARLTQALGEDELLRGNEHAALMIFRNAHRATSALIARFPNEPEVIFAHGQSEFWVGRVYELRRDWPVARRYYARYLAAARRLNRIDPGNPDYMLEAAWGASNRGVVQRDGDGNQVTAQASFEEAVALFERALRARPRDRDARDLANAYGDLADTYYHRREWGKSLNVRFKAYRIYDRLYRADPANAESAYRLVIAQRAVALLSARVGDNPAARQFLAEADRGSRELVQRDPNNADWKLLRTKVECNLLDLAQPADFGNLLQSIDRAGDALEARNNPRVSEIRICLTDVRARLGQR